MKKIKELNSYQKGILGIMLIMIFVFAVIYSRIISQVGFEYKGKIFIPKQENETTIYSGKLDGEEAYFMISEKKTVVFQCGEKTYGPYTAKEDASAIPKEIELSDDMIGIELCEGEKILFRGGFLDLGDSYWLYNEDGSFSEESIDYVVLNGVELDENGEEVDPLEPSVITILELMREPKLTHKGEWYAWFAATFICVLNAGLILFADKLFRWNLTFFIRNAEQAEASEWQIASRYVSWTSLTVAALVLFVVGLR